MRELCRDWFDNQYRIENLHTYGFVLPHVILKRDDVEIMINILSALKIKIYCFQMW